MTDSEVRHFAQAISRVLGWSYFLSWSISFYPQCVLNYRRQSTQGVAIDYPFTNLFGFTCYTISQAAFLFSPTIQSQYAYRNPISPVSTVRFNDFAFGFHAMIMCIVVYSQFWPAIWGFDVGTNQTASPIARGLISGAAISIAAIVIVVIARSPDGGYDPNGWAWIEVIYALSYVKLTITVYKYIPQVWINYKRKATTGFSIWQVSYDFTGSILSLLQLVIDSSLQNDWSGITGNPAKFGLANISMVFNFIFFIQHWWLYPKATDIEDVEDDVASESRPLLGRSGT